MKPKPTCVPCILDQTLRVAHAASDDEWSQRRVLKDVMRSLMDAEWSQTPAELLAGAIGLARQTLNEADPFAEQRAQVQKDFEGIAEEVSAKLAESEDPLVFAALAAAAANVADALIFGRVDLAKRFWSDVEAGFAAAKPDAFRLSLEHATHVLYLLDNSGEVLIDALLIGELRKQGKHVRAVARQVGLLHDATLVEAESLGLSATESEQPKRDEPELALDPEEVGELPDLMENAQGVLGTPPVPGRGDLRQALEEADVVIAKGSANFQTFSHTKKAREVFYLLRAKCEPVAESLGVSVGSLVMHHQKRPRTTAVRAVKKL